MYLGCIGGGWANHPVLAFASEIERSHVLWTGAPCSPQRTWAEKDGAQPLSNAFAGCTKRIRPRSRVLAREPKAFEKSVFGPCTLGRTWGTRPEPRTVLGDQIRDAPGLLALGSENQRLTDQKITINK